MDPGNKLELLAPAKNLECGIAAIHHGADAVYIGAPKFSAREAAGNSIMEIERLAAEARIFGVKTYVAFNTILFDHELEEAEKIIRQVYEAGADALIIQDFGILEMDLPPIALHASTQANNFTVEKLKFLEEVGFKRAVLARELSLQQIEEIASQTSIELEAFVHGSLCVSLSGQCFMSHSAGGRSANRGACAQPCRKKYMLTDAEGRVIIRDKHLLSLKDLNRSGSLRQLASAGIRSFKIEGRLKDADYVKNVTAYYREELDKILEEKPGLIPASVGKTSLFFKPDPAKTFHRADTEYFLHGRTESVAGFESSKSTGEEIGQVTKIARDSFQFTGARTLSNNDGLSFVNRLGESTGLKVNRVEGNIVYPDKMNGVFAGALIFRNYDHSFQQLLSKKTSERKIHINLILQTTPEGFGLRQSTTTVEISPFFSLQMEKVPANDPTKSRENIIRQLTKSGDTPFLVMDIDTSGNEQYFFTTQQLNELRRGLLSQLVEASVKPIYKSLNSDGRHESVSMKQMTKGKKTTDTIPYPVDDFKFENNISNRLALQFFRRHGIENPVMGVEKWIATGRLQVMITKHCLQHELGFCKKFGGSFPSGYTLPFSLQDGTNRFELEFDCPHCLMRVFRQMS
jgi:putative protease